MNTPSIESAIACVTMPGQSQSGDRHVVHPYPNGVMLAVIDGIGHGKEAAKASDLAVTLLKKHAQESLNSIIQQCHARLRETRGVVMSLAMINEVEGTLTWTSVGNVGGVVIRGASSARPRQEPLLLRAGVVGDQLPSFYTSVIRIVRGDTLILATDGIHSNFTDVVGVSDPPQQIANHILAKYNKGSDDALVLVARYLK